MFESSAARAGAGACPSEDPGSPSRASAEPKAMSLRYHHALQRVSVYEPDRNYYCEVRGVTFDNADAALQVAIVVRGSGMLGALQVSY